MTTYTSLETKALDELISSVDLVCVTDVGREVVVSVKY